MIDFDVILAENSSRFVAVLRDLPGDAPVPSCPEWSAADLLWHLTYVQAHWAGIVERRVPPDEGSDPGPRPQRPASQDEVVARFESGAQRLQDALAGAADTEAVWTWSTDRTIAWVRRRQAQEAMVHRVDAELAAGLPSDLDPVAAADGVDELLGHFGAPSPAWGSFEPTGPVVAVRASDAAGSWRVQLGRFRGVDPDGAVIDEADYQPAPDSQESDAATITGSAGALLLWLWGRADGSDLVVAGDASAMPALREAIVANA